MAAVLQERVLFPGPELEPGKKISPKQQMNEFERRQEKSSDTDIRMKDEHVASPAFITRVCHSEPLSRCKSF